MRTAHLLLFVSVLSLCCASGLAQDLTLIAQFFEFMAGVTNWLNERPSTVPDPAPFTIGGMIRAILVFIFVVAVAVFWICVLTMLCFKASVIKLEVALVPAANGFWNHIQSVERRTNTEGNNRRKKKLMSELVSCLKDNLKSISSAKCQVKYYWWIGKEARKRKYIYAEQLAGMQKRKETNVKSEEVENLTVTILIAAKGMYDVPTLSHREKVGVALHEIAVIPYFNIEACDVSCHHGVPNLEASDELGEENYLLPGFSKLLPYS